jgi:hypothetical protein
MASAGAGLVSPTGAWGRRGTRDVYADFNTLTLEIVGRGLHSLTSELNLRVFGTHR